MSAQVSQEVALRKRQQIDSSKKTMFIAVAVAAFISGVALVVAYFLIQQIWFHASIINAKQETLATIEKNTTAVKELEDKVRVLDTNAALSSVKSSDESNALQVILDALPAEANGDALGASLQKQFVGQIDGLTVETMSVDLVDAAGEEVVAEEVTTEETASGDETGAEGQGQVEISSPSIGFQMSVSGSAEGLKALLARFERSIRVIKITHLEIQASEQGLTMNITGKAYYEPARVIELGTRVKKPGEQK